MKILIILLLIVIIFTALAIRLFLVAGRTDDINDITTNSKDADRGKDS